MGRYNQYSYSYGAKRRTKKGYKYWEVLVQVVGGENLERMFFSDTSKDDILNLAIGQHNQYVKKDEYITPKDIIDVQYRFPERGYQNAFSIHVSGFMKLTPKEIKEQETKAEKAKIAAIKRKRTMEERKAQRQVTEAERKAKLYLKEMEKNEHLKIKIQAALEDADG